MPKTEVLAGFGPRFAPWTRDCDSPILRDLITRPLKELPLATPGTDLDDETSNSDSKIPRDWKEFRDAVPSADAQKNRPPDWSLSLSNDYGNWRENGREENLGGDPIAMEKFEPCGLH